jgi:hypothetical protein
LGERFNGIEEVVGSIPSGSTNQIFDCTDFFQDRLIGLAPKKIRWLQISNAGDAFAVSQHIRRSIAEIHQAAREISRRNAINTDLDRVHHRAPLGSVSILRINQ